MRLMRNFAFLAFGALLLLNPTIVQADDPPYMGEACNQGCEWAGQCCFADVSREPGVTCDDICGFCNQGGGEEEGECTAWIFDENNVVPGSICQCESIPDGQ